MRMYTYNSKHSAYTHGLEDVSKVHASVQGNEYHWSTKLNFKDGNSQYCQQSDLVQLTLNVQICKF